MLRAQRTNTTAEAGGRALTGLSEMVFPLPGSQAKCWPLLTLVLSPHCAKCYLWCHIWPRGSGPKLQHPVSLWRFPTELAATIPEDSLPAYFLPLPTHAQKQQIPHATLKTAGTTPFDFAATNTTLCVAKFIIALCHGILCLSLYSSVSLLSLSLRVCVCVSALFFVCAFPSSEGAEVTKAHLWPLCLSRQQQRFININ